MTCQALERSRTYIAELKFLRLVIILITAAKNCNPQGIDPLQGWDQ